MKHLLPLLLPLLLLVACKSTQQTTTTTTGNDTTTQVVQQQETIYLQQPIHPKSVLDQYHTEAFIDSLKMGFGEDDSYLFYIYYKIYDSVPEYVTNLFPNVTFFTIKSLNDKTPSIRAFYNGKIYRIISDFNILLAISNSRENFSFLEMFNVLLFYYYGNKFEIIEWHDEVGQLNIDNGQYTKIAKVKANSTLNTFYILESNGKIKRLTYYYTESFYVQEELY